MQNAKRRERDPPGITSARFSPRIETRTCPDCGTGNAREREARNGRIGIHFRHTAKRLLRRELSRNIKTGPGRGALFQPKE